MNKLPRIGTNIFTLMTSAANEAKSINLGQGFPDFPMDKRLQELVTKAMADNYNQYAPMAGWMPLRERLSEKIDFLYQTKINPDTEITITPGGTYAIYTVFTTILEPGDEVIVIEPCYDSYIPNIEVNGGIPILIPLKLPGYRIDWEAIRNAITNKTKALIINSPHNPTGTVISESDIEELRNTVAGTNIYIISDEVYEHLIYDGLQHLSIMRYADLMERSFVCFSFGKVFNCTGWKLGYMVAPTTLTNAFRKIHQFNCFSCFTPAQVALSEFMKQKSTYLDLSFQMQEKRDYFIRLMKETKFTLFPSSGSYFICSTYEKISDQGDMDFSLQMTKEFGVTPIPVSAFYQNGKDDKVIRFCFTKKKETIEAAVERLVVSSKL
ncbi:MAG: aminotransferase class I/II-fold pyridoxal phosphate-dependent enzyme [Chitinophagaceae bacterium]|nr:aminotransferase class I/II-fold pyridoxal phosphate-dependent enzyme [Chitinophagaceae bacterium]